MEKQPAYLSATGKDLSRWVYFLSNLWYRIDRPPFRGFYGDHGEIAYANVNTFHHASTDL